MRAVGKQTWIGKDFEQEESERHFVCLSGKTALYCFIAVLACIQYEMEIEVLEHTSSLSVNDIHAILFWWRLQGRAAAQAMERLSSRDRSG